ncbi:MAG: sugar transferase [Candidatus Buchananbacteria bacterium]
MKRSEIFFGAILVPVDLLMIMLASLTAYWIRFGQYASSLRPVTFKLPWQTYLWYSLLVAAVWLIIFALAKLYVIAATRSWREEFRRLFFACTTGLLVVILIDFARHELFSSRFIVLAVWLLSIIYIGFGRWLIRHLQQQLLRRGIGVHRIVIIGQDKASQVLTQYFKNNYKLGYVVVKVFIDFSPTIKQELQQLIQQDKVDEILAGSPHLAKTELQELYAFSYEHHLPLKYVADLFAAQAPKIEISFLAGIPVVEVKKTKLDGWGRVAKRLSDLIGAIILIIIFSPIMLLEALAIKLDSAGPVFFAYQRIGQNGKTFRYFKFRSMKHNTHHLRYDDEFVLQQQNLRNGTPVIKFKNDPRITRVGKIIRRFSLDELAELFLVLIGQMSLVGPRPHEVEEVARYDQWQKRVLNIKPGMTGLAQVSGRSDLAFNQEVNLDIYYMEHWSWLQDLVILVKTPLAVLRKRRAE